MRGDSFFNVVLLVIDDAPYSCSFVVTNVMMGGVSRNIVPLTFCSHDKFALVLQV